MAYCDYMCVVCEHLKGDRIDQLAQSARFCGGVLGTRVAITGEVQLYELFLLQWFPCYRVRWIFRQPLRYHLDIEYGTISGTDWMLERLKRCGAKVKG